jgi:hypothetical protein
MVDDETLYDPSAAGDRIKRKGLDPAAPQCVDCGC